MTPNSERMEAGLEIRHTSTYVAHWIDVYVAGGNNWTKGKYNVYMHIP